MTLRSLQKWHGAGNDFLVEVVEHTSVPWWSASRAAAVLNRTTGVGADGLLVASLGEKVSMVLYNADGSIAEMSGNGIRCLAAAVRRHARAEWDVLQVHTDAGVRTVQLQMQTDFVGYGSVEMGEVRIRPRIDDVLGVADVGNPHIVVADDPTWTTRDCEERAERVLAKVGNANVEFVTVLDPTRVRIRVIERGVGWTNACGTGSVATAAVCQQEGLTNDEVTVENPGGSLQVKLVNGHASLAGPVHFIADVEWFES